MYQTKLSQMIATSTSPLNRIPYPHSVRTVTRVWSASVSRRSTRPGEEGRVWRVGAARSLRCVTVFPTVCSHRSQSYLQSPAV